MTDKPNVCGAIHFTSAEFAARMAHAIRLARVARHAEEDIVGVVL